MIKIETLWSDSILPSARHRIKVFEMKFGVVIHSNNKNLLNYLFIFQRCENRGVKILKLYNYTVFGASCLWLPPVHFQDDFYLFFLHHITEKFEPAA